MLVIIDNERAKAYQKLWGERIMAARVHIKYRLEDMTAVRCLIMRYHEITPDMLAELGAKAIFISGNSANPNEYTAQFHSEYCTDEHPDGRILVHRPVWHF